MTNQPTYSGKEKLYQHNHKSKHHINDVKGHEDKIQQPHKLKINNAY